MCSTRTVVEAGGSRLKVDELMMPSAVLGTRTVVVVRRRCDAPYCSCDRGTGTVGCDVYCGRYSYEYSYAEDVIVQYAYEYPKD